MGGVGQSECLSVFGIGFEDFTLSRGTNLGIQCGLARMVTVRITWSGLT